MEKSEYGEEPYHEAVKKLDSALRKAEKERSQAEKRLIQGGSSIGQAQTEKDDGLSILWSVIGLEVLAGGDEPRERRRKVEELLQKIFNPNKVGKVQGEIDEWINEMYKIRNTIVHQGDTDTRGEVRSVVSEIALSVAVYQARCLPDLN